MDFRKIRTQIYYILNTFTTRYFFQSTEIHFFSKHEKSTFMTKI